MEEELVSKSSNATAGKVGGDPILDPTLTMDLPQYNNESNGTLINATANDEMELVSSQVKEAHSEPSNMDNGPDRDRITEEMNAGDNDTDLATVKGSTGELQECGILTTCSMRIPSPILITKNVRE